MELQLVGTTFWYTRCLRVNSHKSTNINGIENSSNGENMKNANGINFCTRVSSTQTQLTDTSEPQPIVPISISIIIRRRTRIIVIVWDCLKEYIRDDIYAHL